MHVDAIAKCGIVFFLYSSAFCNVDCIATVYVHFVMLIALLLCILEVKHIACAACDKCFGGGCDSGGGDDDDCYGDDGDQLKGGYRIFFLFFYRSRWT